MENQGVADDNCDTEELDQVRDLAKKLRCYILDVDKKIVVLINLKDKDMIYEFEIEESLVSVIEKLYKDQELLKRRFLAFLKKFFRHDERGNLELSQDIFSSTEKELTNSLKTKIEDITKDEEVVDENSSALLSKLNAASVHSEEISINYSSWNVGEEHMGKDSRLLSKKLQMIKYYYLQEGVSNSDQVKFGWLRTGNYDQSGETNVRDSEFEVKNMNEMREKIQRLKFERRRQKEKARIQGNKSFMEWNMAADDNASGLRNKAREIGISLSRHISDFFYVVVENGEAFYKVCDHLKCILKWLVEKEETAVIKRVVSVLEVAERDLSVKGKIRIYQIMSTTSEGREQHERIDRILESFLREVLCLESILSYPNLSTDEDMKRSDSALEVCEKEVEKIGLEMTNLKKTHNYIFEGHNEHLEMESFEATLEWTISEVWQQLEEGI